MGLHNAAWPGQVANRSFGNSLRRVEHFAGASGAGAARGGNTQRVLQRIEAGTPGAGFSGDGVVGHATAKANDHGQPAEGERVPRRGMQVGATIAPS